MISKYRFQNGVTLVEMLAAMVVAGILLGIAIPGIQSTLVRSEIRNEAIRLMADIQYARSEAVKRHSGVNLCRSKTAGDGCTGPDCDCVNGLAQRQWDDGWLIYTADGSDATFDPDADTLLRIGSASPAQITIRANQWFNRWISVDGGTGSLDEAGNGKLAVCMNGESTADAPGMVISVHLSGRPNISKIPVGGDCDYPPVL
jgi:type IV fimbrial biogenesis protein FimT